MLKPLPKQEDYVAKIAEDEENVTYKSISAVKLGCNRCTQVFYSEGGYNDHLFKKHRVRNVLRNPPTVINKLWSKIPERQPLFEGQNECEICGARYFDKLFYYRHVRNQQLKSLKKNNMIYTLFWKEIRSKRMRKNLNVQKKIIKKRLEILKMKMKITLYHHLNPKKLDVADPGKETGQQQKEEKDRHL